MSSNPLLAMLEEIQNSPHSTGRDGIHISAQLRIDALQLQNHRIGWAARTMETAANRIDELENRLAEARGLVNKESAPQEKEIMYAVGVEQAPESYGMTNGPTPNLDDMLEVFPDTVEGSWYLFRFDPDGSSEKLYRWNGKEWKKCP